MGAKMRASLVPGSRSLSCIPSGPRVIPQLLFMRGGVTRHQGPLRPRAPSSYGCGFSTYSPREKTAQFFCANRNTIVTAKESCIYKGVG